MLNMKLIKSRGEDVKLKIYKLINFELNQVISVLEIIPSDLRNNGDTKPILLDTGCSKSSTGFKEDFLEGTLVQLFHTYLMDGICASLESTHELTLHKKIINDEEEFSVL